MNHPSREEWVPFLFGETDAATRRRLAAHLKSCPDCGREIQAWRRSLGRLDSWRLPRGTTALAFTWQPMVKWAWAAMLVLGVGFLAGRFTTPSRAEIAQLRGELQSSLRAELQQSLAQAQERNASATAETEERLTKTSAAERQKLLRSFLQVLASARTEDAQSVQALFQQLQDQHKTDLIAVRTDLETMASMTDDQFRQARLKLTQLAALAQNDQ